ncbi:YybH family protein [Halodesulfovibrio marinisediminis]|uniref:Ketosteroid isomerase homolog n=1 Tax=Halodesulfovibrio marinisediminis DSM 17456 TaxID=1121457 RepID=A0A1N6IE43_9BACT|nr:nuclear transport factor 2 family protein [Halodesulfovibrio marinisediminis]SIO30297.1 Ketosteroid isomerase homolog [Halodesulfovibrio marinisediminis DSM 17456]
MKNLVGLLMVCMLLPAGAFAEEPVIPLEKITDPDMAHALFVKAMNEKNIDQLCAMYTDDAVMVLRDGKLEVSGPSRIRRVFSIMVDMVESLDIETVYQVEAENTVLFRSKYRSVYVTPDGEREEVVSSGVEVLEKQEDGTWLFTIDHQNGGANVL